MKRFFGTFQNVFAYYFASIGISLLVEVLLNIPLKLIFTNFNDFSCFLISFIAFLASVIVLFYRYGYKYKKFEFKLFIFSLLLLLFLIVALIYIIGHAVYISGPTVYLTLHLFNADGLLINKVETLHQFCTLLTVGAYVLLYSALMMLFYYLGVKKRMTLSIKR